MPDERPAAPPEELGAVFAPPAPAAPAAAAPAQATPAAALAPPGARARNNLVPSGVPGLDELIEGGFDRQSVVLVTGDPGAGKTTFLTQFLYQGVTKFNEPGVFITFEERKEDLVRHMKSYGWDLAALEKDKRLVILDYPPHEIERFLTEGEILRDTILNVGAKRVAIDSLSTFALIFENQYKMRLGILKVLDQFKKWGATVLATGEGRINERGEVEDRFGLEALVDGFIYLYNLRRGERRERALEVIELKGVRHSTVVHPLLFERGGLRVEH
jgi:circadian clock protein KaiC